MFIHKLVKTAITKLPTPINKWTATTYRKVIDKFYGSNATTKVVLSSTLYQNVKDRLKLSMYANRDNVKLAIDRTVIPEKNDDFNSLEIAWIRTKPGQSENDVIEMITKSLMDAIEKSLLLINLKLEQIDSWQSLDIRLTKVHEGYHAINVVLTAPDNHLSKDYIGQNENGTRITACSAVDPIDDKRKTCIFIVLDEETLETLPGFTVIPRQNAKIIRETEKLSRTISINHSTKSK
jgi:hypothetical protein